MGIPHRRVQADWELSKLVHDLDLLNNAQMRERIAGLDITVAQASALYELSAPTTIGELATHMSCEPSNATAVIDRLERQGLVERRPHPTDRRARYLHLTTEGTARRERLLELLRAGGELIHLNAEDRETLRLLLERALGR